MGKLFLSTFLFLLILSNGYSQNPAAMDSLLAIDLTNATPKYKVRIYNLLALNSITAQQIIKYADQIREHSQSELDLASADLHYSQAYKYLGDIPKSIEYAFKAYQVFAKHNKTRSLAVVANKLASAYLEAFDYDNAIKYFHDAIKFEKIEGDSINLAGHYNNLGETYRLNAKADSALYYFQLAKEIYSSKGYRIGTGYVIGNIGLIYLKQGNFPVAEAYIHHAISILKEYEDPYPILIYQLALAERYYEEGLLNKSLSICLPDLSTAISNGLRAQARDISLLVSKNFEALQDKGKALHYFRQHIAYKDSIVNHSTLQRISDLQASFKLEQNEAEINHLRQQKKSQHLMLVAMSVVVILLLAFALLLYRHKQQKQQMLELLQLKNKQLQRQNEQIKQLALRAASISPDHLV